MTDLNSIPDADKATYWQNHLNQWQSSGLTQKDYCREQHLSHRQFLYWRSREKLLQQQQAMPVCAVPVSVVSHHRVVESDFSKDQIELCIGLAKLRLPLDTQPAYIATLVSALT